MALDALFLRFVSRELSEKAVGTRVDKIYQPSKDELLLCMRGYDKCKIILSAAPGSARIHITEQDTENPKTPSGFCMALRKHLLGAKLTEIFMPKFERVVMLRFEAKNDFFETVEKTLVIEIMGRTSNIILVDDTAKILQAIRPVDFTMTRNREILPGLTYEMPPSQDKCSFLAADKEQLQQVFCSGKTVSSAILDAFSGISPIVAREIAFRAVGRGDRTADSLTESEKNALYDTLLQLQKLASADSCEPHILCDATSGEHLDFSFFPILQYGSAATKQKYTSANELLENYYTAAAAARRQQQRAASLTKLVSRTLARITRTHGVRKKELADSENADAWMQQGQLIQANMHQIKKGDTKLQVANFFEPDLPMVTIHLQPDKTAVQNAQSCFKKYNKAKKAREVLHELLEKDAQEMAYLESVLLSLLHSENEEDLLQIRSELVSAGYIKSRKAMDAKKPTSAKPRKFVLSDGYTLWVGKNNLQNDQITVRISRKNDIWLHTKAVHSTHALLVTGGQDLDDIPVRAIEEAAAICAYYSKGKNDAKVEVDYCPVQHVKKPAGAKPGMVVYDGYYTVIVSPDAKLCERMRVQ